MRANSRDIARLLVSMAERSSTDDLPDQARAISALMPDADEAGTGELAGALLGDGPPSAGLDDDARREFTNWWDTLSTKEAAGLDADLSRADFSRVSVTDDASAIGRLNADVAADHLFAYFVIGPDPVASSDGFWYVSKNMTDNALQRWYGNLATEIVRARRIAARPPPAVDRTVRIRTARRACLEAVQPQYGATDESLPPYQGWQG